MAAILEDLGTAHEVGQRAHLDRLAQLQSKEIQILGPGRPVPEISGAIPLEVEYMWNVLRGVVGSEQIGSGITLISPMDDRRREHFRTQESTGTQQPIIYCRSFLFEQRKGMVGRVFLERGVTPQGMNGYIITPDNYRWKEGRELLQNAWMWPQESINHYNEEKK